MSGLSTESRTLVDLARNATEPSPTQQERVRAALALRFGAGVSGGGSGPSTPPIAPAVSSVAPLFAKIAVGLALLGGGAAALLVPSDRPDYARAALAMRQVSIAPALSPIATPPPPIDAPVEPQLSGNDNDDVPPPPSRPAPVALPARRVVEAPKPAPSTGPDIVGEIAVLRDAQESLRAGEPARAAASLEAFEAAHPKGALGEERTAARLIARCASQSPSARAEAESFLAAHPASPLAARVRASCAPPTR